MHYIKIHLDIVSKIDHVTHPDGSRVVDDFMEKVIRIPFEDEFEMEDAFDNIMYKLEDGVKFLRIQGMGIATANIFLVEMMRDVEA